MSCKTLCVVGIEGGANFVQFVASQQMTRGKSSKCHMMQSPSLWVTLVFIKVSNPSSWFFVIDLLEKVTELQGSKVDGFLKYLFKCENCYQIKKRSENQKQQCQQLDGIFFWDIVSFQDRCGLICFCNMTHFEITSMIKKKRKIFLQYPVR